MRLPDSIDTVDFAWLAGALTGASIAYLYAESDRPRVDIIIEDPALLE